MPIKFQALGGGGYQTLIISTNPNAQVKLSNEKYNKTITTNEHGRAEFKNLRAGIYVCVVKINPNKVLMKELVIEEYRDEYLGVLAQLKDVPLREKVKLSNGLKFTIMNKNLRYHQSNSVTMSCDVCFDVLQSSQYAYKGTDAGELSTKYFDQLKQHEKENVILHSFYYDHLNDSSYQNPVWKYATMQSYFYAPSTKELNTTGEAGNENDGVPLGFKNNQERIKHDSLGQSCKYITRSVGYKDRDNIYGWHYFVNPKGELSESGGEFYFAPCCDIKGDAWVSKDADGYWKIVENKNTSSIQNLPLKSKIKLSSGKKFILRAKNVSGHRDNTVTLMSEHIIENAKWSNGIEKVPYSSSDIRTKTLQGCYNELSLVEKTRVIPYDSFGNVWLMAQAEAGSLNLSVQSDRVMRFSNGNTGDWFTRDYRNSVGEQTQDGEPQDGVIKYKRDSFQDITKVWTGGKFADDEAPEYTGVEISYSNDPTWRTESGAYKECGIVPFLDLDGDAMCEKGSDGYWKIIG